MSDDVVELQAEIERLREEKADILKTCAWLLDRNVVIEECARVVDTWKWTLDDTVFNIATAIRALKDKP